VAFKCRVEPKRFDCGKYELRENLLEAVIRIVREKSLVDVKVSDTVMFSVSKNHSLSSNVDVTGKAGLLVNPSVGNITPDCDIVDVLETNNVQLNI
jgi:hypothetical protein